MNAACDQFVKALWDAEANGISATVDQLAKYVTPPPGKSAIDVFEMCKQNGWVMGTPKGPWLTEQGKKQTARSS